MPLGGYAPFSAGTPWSTEVKCGMRRTCFVLVGLWAIVAVSQVAAVADPTHSTRAKRTYASPGVNVPLAMVSCSGKDVGVATGNGGFGVQSPQVSFRTQSAFRPV